MPAQRSKPSLGPHSLELLYSKYGPDKMHASCSPSLIPTVTTTSTTTTVTKPTSSSTPVIPTPRRNRHRRHPPPPVLRGPALGDLSKLGCGLSKLERVHLLLDITPHTGRTSGQLMMKSRSQPPSSAGVNPASSVPDATAVCSECCQTHRPTEGQSKLKDLKSKLRLVAPRSLPDKPPSSHTDSSSPTVQQRQPPSQHVVPLPLLHIRFQQQSQSGSRDFPAVQNAAGQALRRMLFPQNNRSSVAVWNFKTSRGGSQPARSRELLESMDASSRFLTSAGMAAPSSGWRQRYGADSISTYDSDRVDSEQFEYVFDQFSSLSTEESESCTTVTPESDTATFSARAQRPSTTDTVATHQRLSHSWSSRSRRLSPISATRHRAPASRGSSPVTPQHRARASRESWPPHFTVIPSWPAVDDPFRFQYLGRGVQRDIMRRLQHRSQGSGGKKLGKARDSVEAEQPTQLQPQHVQQPVLPQKLEIVVPTHTECHLCKTYECEHTITPRQTHTTARSTRPPSLSARSSGASEGRPDTVHCSKKPATGPAVNGDSDPVPWCLEERCVAQGNEVTFDRGHYTAHNAVN